MPANLKKVKHCCKEEWLHLCDRLKVVLHAAESSGVLIFIFVFVHMTASIILEHNVKLVQSHRTLS